MIAVILVIGLALITLWWLFTWMDRKEAQRRTKRRRRWAKRIADDTDVDNPLDL